MGTTVYRSKYIITDLSVSILTTVSLLMAVPISQCLVNEWLESTQDSHQVRQTSLVSGLCGEYTWFLLYLLCVCGVEKHCVAITDS